MTVIISIDLLLLKILTYYYYYLYIIFINYSLKNCRGLTNYIWNNW